MKIKKFRRTAFFNLRALITSFLCLAAGMLTLFALGPLAQPDNNTGTIRSSGWLTRLASSVGIESRAQPGGAIKLDKYPAAPPPGATQPPAGPYTGPVRNLRPVTAVRSGNLRDMRPIDPASVPKIYYREPIRPKLPTQSGGGRRARQDTYVTAGSAPTSPPPHL